jgi:glycosyltransferase involved in cell wall biosynthesis
MRNLYYTLKPFVPRNLRIAIRQSVAFRKLARNRDIWPIDDHAGRTPEGWPGWPDGKKFAVVLTHDVEGTLGVAKTPLLQQLESSLGFRSSFNFIPAGDYRVSAELRQSLVSAGWEVGVHDFHHDGKLFRGPELFSKKAALINQCLTEWEAVGFRAGFMLRNLDWYHQLNILYDASTFDTDPFEPMPEGFRTIFPFWVDRSQIDPAADPAQGYVELPYTLPQDSTLYLILGETSPKIWIDKLRWIVKHGGMVLLNIHPDYVRFSDDDKQKLLFPSEFYSEFLRVIRDEYAGQYWNPTPRELALWYKDQHLKKVRAKQEALPVAIAQQQSYASLKGKRAAVILYSGFPSDPRPRRAAEAMVQEGMEVDFFCLGDKPTPAYGERSLGIRVFRYAMTKRRDSKFTYFYKYGRFLAAAFWFLTKRSLKVRYDIVHVHNMPDILVFSALIPKLRGAKVIIDLHDPMPELMTTIFGADSKSFFVRQLRWLEKLSIGFANRVFTVNIACKRIFANRSCADEKITVVMNSPDEAIFQYHDIDELAVKEKPSGSFVMMFHGSLVERHGLDLAVNALAAILEEIPGAELRIYGATTPHLTKVMESISDPRLKQAVHYKGAKPQEEIVKAIGECDLGVIPNRRSIFTELNTPTRIFEYLSQGKPVLAPRSPGILDYFGPDDLIYFDLGDEKELAEKMRWAFNHPAEVRQTVRRGQAVFRAHSWPAERATMLNECVALLRKPTGRVATSTHETELVQARP